MTTKTTIVKQPKEKEDTTLPTSPNESPTSSDPTPTESKEIKVIERIFETKEIAPQDAFGKLSRNQIELIKSTVAKGASDDELRLFIQVCKGANLNPFLRQVHLVPRWDSKLEREVRTIQVGIDGFRAVAESSGQYAGNDDPTFDGEKTIEFSTKSKAKNTLTVPQKASSTVYKLMDGQRYPFTATARWEEYYPGEKMGFQWHIRPYLMLGKCAEALALRKAFPKLLSGMYAQEEMDRTVGVENEAKKIQTGREKLLSMIESTDDPKVLQDYKEKIEKSEKYTEDQKAELCIMIDDKIKKLEK